MATHRPMTSSGAADAPQQPVSNLNIANAVTMVRLVLVPVFIAVLLPAQYGDPASTHLWWWGFGIFVIAGITDKIDGYLARSRGLITDFGKLADSIADKALVISALILLSLHDLLPWWITVLMIVRELGITLMRMAMVKREVMAAGKGGKLKMVLQVVFIAWLLVPWYAFLPANVAGMAVMAGIVLAVVTLAVALVSAGQYVVDAVRIVRRGSPDSSS